MNCNIGVVSMRTSPTKFWIKVGLAIGSLIFFFILALGSGR